MNFLSEKMSKYRYYVLLICCFFASFLNIFPQWKRFFKFPNQFLLLVLICVVLASYAVVFYKNIRISDREIIFLIFAFGFVFRLVYGIATDYYVRQHDLDVGYATGHWGYIRRLYFGEGLPNENILHSWQFYQPPLWHSLCAFFLKIQTFFKIPIENAFENLQMISLFCSSSVMLLSHKLFKMFGLEKIPLYIACGIVAFHPTLIILSASINNDIISIALSLLSVIIALKWYRNPDFKTIIMLALSIGLSMAAKLSGGLVSLAIAMLFVIRLFGKKYKNKLNLIGQFSVFGIICVPLALWWQIRNLIFFNVPITYVPKLSETSNQYIGFRSIFERFFDFSSLSESIYPLRVVSYQNFEYFEYNIPLAALKTSVFGEYYIGQNSTFTLIFANVLFWTAFVIALSSVIGAFYMLFRIIKDKNNGEIIPSEYIFTLVCTLTLIISYVKFCFDFPHFCTMDFRYITLTVVFAALYIALLLKDVSKNNKIFGKVMLYTSSANLILFMLSSVAVYCTIA